jgi:thermitase
MFNVLKCLALPSVLLVVSLESEALEYIVKLRDDPYKHDLYGLSENTNNLYKTSDVVVGLKLIKVDAYDAYAIEDPIPMLKQFFDAEYVVPNTVIHAFYNQTDPLRKDQWALDIIQAEAAWNSVENREQLHKIIVAIVDTGIALKHEDLAANLWVNNKEVAQNNLDDDQNGYIDDVNGWDFHGNDSTPEDEVSQQNPGHGSHCAGIIGAVCGNEVGICGINPYISLMPLRFLGPDGSGDLFSSIKAIEYAAQNGAHIISASWGATMPEANAQPLIEAIKKAEEKGVIFVAAAANDGRSNDRAGVYPANAQTPHMIAVAASNKSDQKPPWSNYGRKVDIAAPGEDIISTIPEGYRTLSGTSMATPLVAGLSAFLKAIDNNLSGAQVRSILQSTGATVAIETASNRRIDAHKAVEAVKNRTLTVIPAAHTFKLNDQFDFSAWGGVAPYKFSSLNPDIVSIDENGHLIAKALGDAVIEVSDSAGNSARSVSIKVGDSSSGGGPECPLGNELLCAIMCILDPQLPWCQQGAEAPLPGFPLPFPLPIPYEY